MIIVTDSDYDLPTAYIQNIFPMFPIHQFQRALPSKQKHYRED